MSGYTFGLDNQGYSGLGFNNATLNGSNLSSTQVGLQNTMAPLSSSGMNVGGAVAGANVTAASAPGTTQQGSFLKNADGSFNTNNLKTILGGIEMLGSIWNSFQQQKIAKEQLALARETFQTNLENNKKTYNTALEDRIRSRYVMEGRSSAEADSYLASHNL